MDFLLQHGQLNLNDITKEKKTCFRNYGRYCNVTYVFTRIVSFVISGSSAGKIRFNVTVVASGGQEEGGASAYPVSPVPRHHRTHPFASIPEDYALDDPENQKNRSASPAPSWDFSNDSDSVSKKTNYDLINRKGEFIIQVWRKVYKIAKCFDITISSLYRLIKFRRSVY